MLLPRLGEGQIGAAPLFAYRYQPFVAGSLSARGGQRRFGASSQLPVPSDLRQPHDGSYEDADGGISSGRKQSRVQYRCFGRPANDDHGLGFVGFDQLYGDRVAAVDLARGNRAWLLDP
jgi:hypothetical protein